MLRFTNAHTIPRTALQPCALHVPVPCATFSQGLVLHFGLPMLSSVSYNDPDIICVAADSKVAA